MLNFMYHFCIISRMLKVPTQISKSIDFSFIPFLFCVYVFRFPPPTFSEFIIDLEWKQGRLQKLTYDLTFSSPLFSFRYKIVFEPFIIRLIIKFRRRTFI